MQHLVINDVFYQMARSRRGVEFATDDNCSMSGIVVAQDTAGILMAPSQAGQGNLTVKKAVI